MSSPSPTFRLEPNSAMRCVGDEYGTILLVGPDTHYSIEPLEGQWRVVTTVDKAALEAMYRLAQVEFHADELEPIEVFEKEIFENSFNDERIFFLCFYEDSSGQMVSFVNGCAIKNSGIIYVRFSVTSPKYRGSGISSFVRRGFTQAAEEWLIHYAHSKPQWAVSEAVADVQRYLSHSHGLHRAYYNDTGEQVAYALGFLHFDPSTGTPIVGTGVFTKDPSEVTLQDLQSENLQIRKYESPCYNLRSTDLAHVIRDWWAVVYEVKPNSFHSALAFTKAQAYQVAALSAVLEPLEKEDVSIVLRYADQDGPPKEPVRSRDDEGYRYIQATLHAYACLGGDVPPFRVP